MKRCKDCKWHRRDVPFFWTETFARCLHPKTMEYAEEARQFDCGKKKARHFEPKPPMFYSIRRLFEKPEPPTPEFDFAERTPDADSWR